MSGLKGANFSGHAVPSRREVPGEARGDEAYRRIFEAAGLRLRDGDEARLRCWLEPRLRALRLPSLVAYAELITSDGPDGRKEGERLVRHFTTGETYFFRDVDLFGLLAAVVLPQLLVRRAAQRSLRIWSAGCASGEEAYSIAMLLDEMSQRLVGWDVRILGSDINGEAIERARRGKYGQWSFRGLDVERIERYFCTCGRERQLVERLRAIVSFERRDLLRDAPFHNAESEAFDLILCRNVFIYLSPPAVERIVASLTSALSEGGYLITGHGELLGCTIPGLEARSYPEAVLYGKVASAPNVSRAPLASPDEHSFVFSSPRSRVARPAREFSPRKTHLPAESGESGTSERAATEVGGPGVGATLERAWRDADRGASEAARDACKRVLAIAPLDPQPYYLLAQIAKERGALDEARTLLRNVLYLDPNFVVARLDLADLCLEAGDFHGAWRGRRQALRELERLPPETVLLGPGGRTAGALLQGLQAHAAEGRAGREGSGLV